VVGCSNNVVPFHSQLTTTLGTQINEKLRLVLAHHQILLQKAKTCNNQPIHIRPSLQFKFCHHQMHFLERYSITH